MVTDVGMQNNMYASLLLGCYESLVITSLSERTPLIKEESELCKTIALLSSCFMFNSNESQSKGHREQLITWLRILCKERAIDNVSLTKIIVNMLVKLEREISDFDMVPEFGHDILSALGSCDTGDIDLKLDESQTPIFAIVNLRASNINCVILLEFIEQTCDEIEWPLIRMRLVISKKGYNDEEELIDLGEFENSICKKLVILINTLIYLEQKIAEAGDIILNRKESSKIQKAQIPRESKKIDEFESRIDNKDKKNKERLKNNNQDLYDETGVNDEYEEENASGYEDSEDNRSKTV
ncbi:10051_t:CDS:2 [Entrophospora sp. SA101]|nr:10051_t:CDS:2 [Entrophospora sp. SA101]